MRGTSVAVFQRSWDGFLTCACNAIFAIRGFWKTKKPRRREGAKEDAKKKDFVSTRPSAAHASGLGPQPKDFEQRIVSRKGAKAQRRNEFFAPLRLCVRSLHLGGTGKYSCP
jgi:hypothetical protein